MTDIIEKLVARWTDPHARPLFKGKLIDSDGCACAQGDALRTFGGWSDDKLRWVEQVEADKAVAELLVRGSRGCAAWHQRRSCPRARASSRFAYRSSLPHERAADQHGPAQRGAGRRQKGTSMTPPVIAAGIAFACSVGRVDLSCAQVAAGHAVERYGRLGRCGW